MKIAVVTPIPTPYRDPFWAVVAAEPGAELHVFYCAAGKPDRPWSVGWSQDYPSSVLPGRNLARSIGADAAVYDNPSVGERLASGQFDAVLVGGYNHVTMWRAMRWCRRSGVPYFLMCESHLHVERTRAKTWLKDPVVRRAVRHMAGGLPTGQWAEEYLVHYGGDPKHMARVPNTPDVARLRTEASALRQDRTSLRAALGIENRPTLLFAGRLIRKKGAHIALRALAGVPPGTRPQLAVVGDGPELEPLQALATELGIEQDVHWTGFAEPQDLVRWYAAADAFILPSRETWGVVVLEALACGLPVLLSNEVGCHPDAVQNAHCGAVIQRDDLAAWSRAIEQRFSDPTSTQVDVPEGFDYGSVAQRLLKLLKSHAPPSRQAALAVSS